MRNQVRFLLMNLVFVQAFFPPQAHAITEGLGKAPQLRIKAGISTLTVDAGDRVKGEQLSSMITFQPSILWNLASFNSRIGVHYLQELGGPFGLTPLQGIGFTGYYYFFGVSSDYTQREDGVVLQRSRLGPYLIGSLTPVNFNLNKFVSADPSEDFYFSAVVSDLGLGLGFDYPVMQNLILSGELLTRFGTTFESSTEQVSYSGVTFFLSVGMTYF